MARFFSADYHFGHTNILSLEHRKFKSIDKMNQTIVQKHNEMVNEEDEIFIVGDVSLFGADHATYISKIINKMNGRKHLVLGNHDVIKPFKYIDIGFTSVHTSLELSLNSIVRTILVHDPCNSCIDRSKLFICGHVHDLFIFQKNCINVGVDVWNYYPVSEMTILEHVQAGKVTFG